MDSGYAYDYQMKLSAYTGWTYEHVSGSWPELYQMLLNGEIDLLSDVSLTPEREDQMLFSSLPMGFQVYYACISTKQNTGITAEDLSTFNDKRIGVNKGSLQKDLLIEWMEENSIETEVVELAVNQTEVINMLNGGDIDVFVDIDVYGIVPDFSPVCKIGASDFYFAVTRSRPDLLDELNSAMVRIQEESRNYNYHLQEKYFQSTFASLYFTQNEVNWLAAHGAVRVGYQDNFLAFCGQDPQTGELTGALKDYLKKASVCMKNATIEFDAVPFSTTDEAITALKNGEIDCVFPVNLTLYDGEDLGLLTTEPLMKTEVYAAVRTSDRHHFSPDGDVTVALTETNRNDRTFLMEYFPDWTPAYYDSQERCMQAVAEGEADCVLVCNYQLGKLDDTLQKHELTPITTGRDINFTFAIRSGDDYLYSIMNKTGHYLPESAVNSALVSYSYDEKVMTVYDFLQLHMVAVVTVLGTILAIILFFLANSMHSTAKAKASLRALKESLSREEKQKKELDVTKDKAYTDSLTGVKNKNAYVEAWGALQQRIADGEKPEFAVVVFDVNDLKRMNDIYDHEAGDRHILSAKKLICNVFKRSPVFRIGGDEFVVILTDTDYENGISLLHSFDQQVEYNLKNGLTVVSAGYAQFDPQNDTSYSEVFQRADDQMYQRKRFLKGEGAKGSLPAQAGLQPQAFTQRSKPSSTQQVISADEGDITIECGGVQIHANGDVATEKLNALIGTLRSK